VVEVDAMYNEWPRTKESSGIISFHSKIEANEAKDDM